jgi:hypothetical protein
MSKQDADQPAGRRRLLLTGALVTLGAVAVAVALSVGALRLPGSQPSGPSAESSAQQRCESDVTKRLAAPDKAHLSQVRTEDSSLDLEGRDLFPVTLEEPLKGVDTSRITVLNVSGVVNAQTEVESTIQDHFTCRAYFVDGALAHTLVVFDEKH